MSSEKKYDSPVKMDISKFKEKESVDFKFLMFYNKNRENERSPDYNNGPSCRAWHAANKEGAEKKWNGLNTILSVPVEDIIAFLRERGFIQ